MRLADIINPSASNFIRSNCIAHLLHLRATALNKCCLHAGIFFSSTSRRPALVLVLSSRQMASEHRGLHLPTKQELFSLSAYRTLTHLVSLPLELRKKSQVVSSKAQLSTH